MLDFGWTLDCQHFWNIFDVCRYVKDEEEYWLSNKNAVNQSFSRQKAVTIYCKVASINMSHLEAPFSIYWLFIKGKFNDYLLWLLKKNFISFDTYGSN